MAPPAEMRPIGALWALLSTFVGTTALLCLSQPYWLLNESPTTTTLFGPFVVCRLSLFDVEQADCALLLDEPLPPMWTVCMTLIGCSSAAMFVSGVAALLGLCCPDPLFGRYTKLLAKAQILAVGAMLLGCFLLPTTFAEPSLGCVRRTPLEGTGDGGGGDCRVGWSYALAFTTAALGVFCPLLAKYAQFHLFAFETDLTVPSKFQREYFI